MTEQYGITEEQLVEFSKISRKLREILAENKEIMKATEEKKNKMYRDASSIRYGELK